MTKLAEMIAKKKKEFADLRQRMFEQRYGIVSGGDETEAHREKRILNSPDCWEGEINQF